MQRTHDILAELSTHDQMMIQYVFVSALQELIATMLLVRISACCTYEGQFFDDVCEWTRIMVEEKEKKIFICGRMRSTKQIWNWLILYIRIDYQIKIHVRFARWAWIVQS